MCGVKQHVVLDVGLDTFNVYKPSTHKFSWRLSAWRKRRQRRFLPLALFRGSTGQSRVDRRVEQRRGRALRLGLRRIRLRLGLCGGGRTGGGDRGEIWGGGGGRGGGWGGGGEPAPPAWEFLKILSPPSFFMATFSRRTALLQTLLAFSVSFSGYNFLREVESLGINYGQVGNNLPPPGNVLELLQSLNLTKARIYDTNPQVLTAFADSNIDIIVTVENEILADLMNPEAALEWVSTHISPYFPATKISGISVGNEVFTGDDTALMANLVPAMESIHAALLQLGLDQFIHVSTASSLAVLGESYPPSAGCFLPELAGIMPQFLQFLESTKSPFWINAYPYFAYKDDPASVSLDYVLFNPNSGMVDPYTKLQYDNMLYAQVDAVVFAVTRMGFGDVEVRVSETGWPSKGDSNEVGATTENAAVYNRNLLRRQLAEEGTPVRANVRLEVYLFALFNEDLKPGPTSERNYGLFQPDESMAYNVSLTALSWSSSTSSASISLTSSATQVITAQTSTFSISKFRGIVRYSLRVRPRGIPLP
ncbi:hypothetical protein U1Q18_010347 [Sarracenia purpurea var. burkii]